MRKQWHTFQIQSAALSGEPQNVRLYAANLGGCPRGLCFLLPSREATTARDADHHPEVHFYDELATELDRYGIQAVTTTSSQAASAKATAAEAIVARYHESVGLFRFGHRNFPDLPAIVLAAEEGAVVGWHILRKCRPETSSIAKLLIAGSRFGHDSSQRPSCKVSWLCDEQAFLAQMQSSQDLACRRFLAKHYAKILKTSLARSPLGSSPSEPDSWSMGISS